MAEITREEYQRAHHECQSDPKTKIDEDVMRKIRAGEKVTDPNAEAHALCMSKKRGLQDANGKVVKAEVRKGLERFIKDAETIEKALNECAVDKETPEKTAHNLGDCIRKYAPRPQHAHH